MRTIRISIIVFLQLWVNAICFAQLVSVPDSVIFSGIVVDTRTNMNLSDVHCHYGISKIVVSDEEGAFRFKAKRGDTVRFTSVGFKPYVVVIPDTLFQREYILGVFMTPDTLQLSEVLIVRRGQDAWRRDMIYLQNNMAGVVRQAFAPVDEMDARMNQQRMIDGYDRAVKMKGHVDVGLGVGTHSLDALRLLKLRERLNRKETLLDPEEIDFLKKLYYSKKKKKIAD